MENVKNFKSGRIDQVENVLGWIGIISLMIAIVSWSLHWHFYNEPEIVLITYTIAATTMAILSLSVGVWSILFKKKNQKIDQLSTSALTLISILCSIIFSWIVFLFFAESKLKTNPAESYAFIVAVGVIIFILQETYISFRVEKKEEG